MSRLTEQETFWEGEFGNQYTNRNRGPDWIAANTAFFSRIFSRTDGIETVLEFGSNIGLNLLAIRNLLPYAQLSAIEINEKAARELVENLPDVTLYQLSILDFASPSVWDLVFTKGLLIHINPDRLEEVYDLLFQSSGRYILLSEYYNPSPTEVVYRGHTGKLFKRDFAGEMLERFEGLTLVDYGFVYHRDPNFPQDDMTWFLMEKNSRQP